MMTKNKKNSQKDKRIAIASIIIAGTIVAGATFAWFSSKDEVTNRLSASADYNVAITEDFTPEDEWIPGQEINKDVSAINTGNVDAFTRLGIASDLKYQTVGADTVANFDATKNIEITTKEAISMQAGGTMVVQANVPQDPVITFNSNTSAATAAATDGLYVFRREVVNGDETTYDYSGYFYKGGKYYRLDNEIVDGVLTSDINAALDSDNDGLLTAADVALIKLAVVENAAVSNAKFTTTFVTYTAGTNSYADAETLSAATHIKVVYQAGDSANAAKDLTFYIKLADGWSDNWTYVAGIDSADHGTQGKDHIGYFYYNGIHKAGDTTEKLIDSVTLGSENQASAYYKLDYDLSIDLDSVQVTKDSNGDTTAESANSAWATDKVSAAVSGSDVTWTATTA